MNRTTAVFDFDGTLTRHDSFPTFLTHVCGGSRVSMALRFAPYVPLAMMAKAGLADAGKAKEHILRHFLKNLNRKELDSLCSTFVPKLNADLNQSVWARLKEHQKQGDRVVIVSASLVQWIAPWAKSHGITDILATEAEFGADGRMCGFATPNCNGEEKVVRLKKFLATHATEKLIGYGNSRGDYPMLRMCDESYLVNASRDEIRPYK